MMTTERQHLLTVAQAATLISEVTGRDKFEIADLINRTGWEQRYKPGHVETPMLFYTDDGRRCDYRIGIYAQKIDPETNSLIFDDGPPGLYLLVDIFNILDALEYHPDIQKKIIAYLEQAEGAGTDAVKPMPRQRAQEIAILEKLSELGYDPQALPPYGPGKPSRAKAEVKAALGDRGMWAGGKVFGKAWERLTINKQIAYKNNP